MCWREGFIHAHLRASRLTGTRPEPWLDRARCVPGPEPRPDLAKAFRKRVVLVEKLAGRAAEALGCAGVDDDDSLPRSPFAEHRLGTAHGSPGMRAVRERPLE